MVIAYIPDMVSQETYVCIHARHRYGMKKIDRYVPHNVIDRCGEVL